MLPFHLINLIVVPPDMLPYKYIYFFYFHKKLFSYAARYLIISPVGAAINAAIHYAKYNHYWIRLINKLCIQSPFFLKLWHFQKRFLGNFLVTVWLMCLSNCHHKCCQDVFNWHLCQFATINAAKMSWLTSLSNCHQKCHQMCMIDRPSLSHIVWILLDKSMSAKSRGNCLYIQPHC